MPDVCDLILDEHEALRRRFAELDELRALAADAGALEQAWGPLADRLHVHAATEEEVFYPRLLREGDRAEDETADAVDDHNRIRDAVRRASNATVGSDQWWEAVGSARAANSDHMAEEERGAIPEFRNNAALDDREHIGAKWLEFERSHPGKEELDTDNKDADAYISRHREP